MTEAPRPLIDLSDRLGRLQPWSEPGAVEESLHEWLAATGARWLGVEEWWTDPAVALAEALWLLGRGENLPDPDAVAEITLYMLRNLAAGRGATEYDLLGDSVVGVKERTLRRYRDATQVRLDTAIRTLAILGRSDDEIAAEVSRRPQLGTGRRDLDPLRIQAILAADPRNPVEPFSRWLQSFQHRLDVQTMVRAGWKAQSARQWLRRNTDKHAGDAPRVCRDHAEAT